MTMSIITSYQVTSSLIRSVSYFDKLPNNEDIVFTDSRQPVA